MLPSDCSCFLGSLTSDLIPMLPFILPQILYSKVAYDEFAIFVEITSLFVKWKITRGDYMIKHLFMSYDKWVFVALCYKHTYWNYTFILFLSVDNYISTGENCIIKVFVINVFLVLLGCFMHSQPWQHFQTSLWQCIQSGKYSLLGCYTT